MAQRPASFTPEHMGAVLGSIRTHLRGERPPVITLIAQMRRDPFRVLIATILSARTKDAATAAASARLFAKATRPQHIMALGEKELARLIAPVGFAPTKAKHIIATCNKLIDEYKGKVPDTIEQLITLPGVGRKTANLVLIEGFDLPAMCVDTHVHRISNIWGLVHTKSPEQTEFALRATLPKKHWKEFNALLVGFGQHTCTSTSPKCSQCPLNARCPKIGVRRER